MLPQSKGPESWGRGGGTVLILPLVFYSFQVIPGVGGSGILAAQGDVFCCLTLFGVSRQPSNLCQQFEVCQAKCPQSTEQEEREGSPAHITGHARLL